MPYAERFYAHPEDPEILARKDEIIRITALETAEYMGAPPDDPYSWAVAEAHWLYNRHQPMETQEQWAAMYHWSWLRYGFPQTDSDLLATLGPIPKKRSHPIPDPMLYQQDWKYALLTEGDIIREGDEYYRPATDEWLPVQDEFIGYGFEHDVSKPIRRSGEPYLSEEELFETDKSPLEKAFHDTIDALKQQSVGHYSLDLIERLFDYPNVDDAEEVYEVAQRLIDMHHRDPNRVDADLIEATERLGRELDF